MQVKIMINANDLPYFQSVEDEYLKIQNISKSYILGGTEYIDISYEFDQHTLRYVLKDFFFIGMKAGIELAFKNKYIKNINK
jgi:hypothetical protein